MHMLAKYMHACPGPGGFDCVVPWKGRFSVSAIVIFVRSMQPAFFRNRAFIDMFVLQLTASLLHLAILRALRAPASEFVKSFGRQRIMLCPAKHSQPATRVCAHDCRVQCCCCVVSCIFFRHGTCGSLRTGHRPRSI